MFSSLPLLALFSTIFILFTVLINAKLMRIAKRGIVAFGGLTVAAIHLEAKTEVANLVRVCIAIALRTVIVDSRHCAAALTNA